MKKVLNIAAVSFLITMQMYAYLPENIKYAIQKSRPDLLKAALVDVVLTDGQKNDCLKFSHEVLRIREDKMNISRIRPKKTCKRAIAAKLGSMLIGIWSIASFIRFGCLISETKCDEELIATLIATVLCESLLILGGRKLWQYGVKLDVEFFETNRSPKQRYLNAFEIDEILSLL